MNMNEDENEEKLFSISTTFIKKLADFFFIIIGEKASTNLPLNRMYSLNKISKLTCIYGIMYLQLNYYPPYYDKQ